MIYLDNNSSDDFGGIQILSQELSFAHQLTRLPFTRLSSSSCWAWVGGSRCWLSIIVSISPKMFFFCFIHLVVVFHNCGRNRLRVFGRSGLAVPWRFHVWRGGKMNDYVKRGLLVWWGRKTRVRCWMTCVWRTMMMITCVWGRGYTMHGAWVGGRESSTACSLVPPTFHLQEIFLTDFLLLKDRPSSLYCQI